MSPCSKVPVVVVGAGIAGLTAAFRLQRAGCSVTVLERSPARTVGGRMATDDRDGYAIDLGAPLLARGYQRMLSLVLDSGLAGAVLPADDTIGIATPDGVHRGRTGTPARLLRGGVLGAAPVRDRLRILADLRHFAAGLHPSDMSGAAATDDESLTAYAGRRMRPGTLERLLDPLSSTVSLSAPDTTAAITPFLFLALLAKGGGFFTFPTGSGHLPRHLARRLDVRHGASVTQVRERDGEVTVHWDEPNRPESSLRAAAAVLAVPSTAVPPLHPDLPPAQQRFFDRTRYSPVLQVAFCLPRRTQESSVLLHVSRDASAAIASAMLQHNLAPDRVPGGRGLITVYPRDAASRGLWDLPDDAVAGRILAELHRLAILPEAESAVAVHVDRTPTGVVTRAPGEYRTLRAARAAPTRTPRIVLAAGEHFGNSATAASVSAGEKAAERVLRLVGGSRAARTVDRR